MNFERITKANDVLLAVIYRKRVPHQLTLEQLPDDFHPGEFMMLDRESLDRVPYDKRRVCCHIEGCERTMPVRDYGIDPFYYINRRWHRLDLVLFFCAKHWKIEKQKPHYLNAPGYKKGHALNHLI